MKTKTFEGSIENYQGRSDWPGFTFPIKFSGTVETYENLAEVKQSEDWPSDTDILKIVNTKKVTAAKAQEYQKQVADLKKMYEESADFKRKTFIDGAIAMGFSKEEAELLAESKLKK